MSGDLIYIRDRRMPRHYRIDNEVYDMHLGVYALGVYNALSRYASFMQEEARCSQQRVASDLLISVATVKRALQVLVDLKLVMVESGKEKGKANVYTLLHVEKRAAEPKKKVRKADLEGSSQRATPNPGGRSGGATPGSERPTPGSQGATGSSQGATNNKVVNNNNKLLNTEPADAGKYALTEQEKNLVERVCAWHEQLSGLTNGTFNVPKERVYLWMPVYFRELGYKEVEKVFDTIAYGTNPYADAFWKLLKKRLEEKKATLSRMETEVVGRLAENPAY